MTTLITCPAGISESFSMPDEVTSIGENAFYSCKGLTSITIGKGVTSIGRYAFDVCSGLTSINVSDDNTKYKSYDGALYNKDMTKLITCPAGISGSFSVPDEVTSIGENAFDGCSGLTSITIGKGVTSIGENAFSGCSSLTSIDIPDGVTSIGSYAFQYCSGLTSITIGKGVTAIGENAFSGCSGLTSIDIPDGVTSIGYAAFKDCSSLTSITIGKGITLGSYTFYDCSNLTSINVSDDNTRYKSYNGVLYSKDMTALIACPAGISGGFSMPDGVTSIGSHAFQYCSGLTSITIGKGVEYIGFCAFYGCSGLTSIDFPDGVTSDGSHGIMILDGAFQECTNVKKIVCRGYTPPMCEGDYVFYGISRTDCTLYVPEESLSSYQTTAPWSEFLNIVGTTGIQNALADKGLVVSSDGGSITISGATNGSIIEVYNVGGSKIKSVKASGSETTISGLQSGNVYIVKIGKTKFKVAI